MRRTRSTSSSRFAVNDGHTVHAMSKSTVTYVECFNVALFSRVITLTSMILSDSLLPDHDPGGDVRKFGVGKISGVLNTFTRWDAAHYLNIAKNGYESDQSFVFFPVYPYALRLLAKLLKYMTGSFFTEDSLFIASGLSLSNASFILATLMLRKLCSVHYMTPETIRICIWLFSFNPASVFFSAIYTESMYALFALFGMYSYERKNYVLSALGFLLASSTRANGCMNAVPVVADIGLAVVQGRRKSVVSLIFQLLVVVSIISPFITWNYLIPSKLCSLQNMSSIILDWCAKTHHDRLKKDQFYFVYGLLQQVYWNVGFLRQLQIRQIPNFLLALPSVICAFVYIRKIFSIQLFSRYSDRDNFFIVYGLHLLGILVLIVLFAHVQIITRTIFSSSPIICMEIAKSWIQFHEWNLERVVVAYCFYYFISYFIFGVVLHPNFFPWT